MATDNTPPRLRLIVTIAIIVVITLVGLDFVFKSYYAFMTDEAKREKIAPTTEYAAQMAAEKAAFAGAKLPMDQAFSQLKASRSELIEPKPSDDLGAMTGWSKLPKQAPHAAPGAAHAPDADGGAAIDADGGALMNATDGGALTNATDGGTHAADAGATAHALAVDAGATKAPAPPAAKDGGAHTPQH
jgi:hypothetical protein